MRFGLILAIVIAIVAVLFAIQNQGTTALHLGTYTISVLTPVLLILTFGIGAIVGMLLALPSAISRGRRVKVLERQLRDSRPTAVPVASSSPMTAIDSAMADMSRRETRL